MSGKAEERNEARDVQEDVAVTLTYVLSLMVDDAFTVEREPGGTDVTILRVTLAPADIGKVIGKQGRTARSLRTILGAASMKFKQRFTLDIVETGKECATEART